MKKVIYGYLIISISIALYIYKDFGISWDESMQRRTGQINYDYIFNGTDELKSWIDQDYGVVFELPLYIAEKLFKWEDKENGERYVFIYRHLATHLFYIIGGVFLFLLVSQLFKSKAFGILSLFLYMLQPRIYAHSFYNTKDIPLMVGFICCFYILYKFLNKRTLINALILGLSAAVLINIRILGIIFPAMALFYIVLFDTIDGGFMTFKKEIKNYAIIVISTLIFTYLFWPVLWEDPIGKFIEIFKNMAHFRHDTYELVFGEFIKASQDKSYFFKWFFTTVPVGYLFLGCSGILTFIYSIVKSKLNFLKNHDNRFIGLILCFLIVPLAIIILRNSVLYNGWRQLFFVYPSFIIMIVYAFKVLNKTRFKKGLVVVSSVYLCFIIIQQMNLHPFQAIYFNELVSKNKNHIVKNFEFDYWGSSYKDALEKIVSTDNSDTIYVAVSEHVGYANFKILPLKDKNRLHYVENIKHPQNIKKADYFISNFYSDDLKFENKQLYFQIRRYNNPVISIFKLK